MGFLFFVILIIIIVNVTNSNKNTQNNNITYKTSSYSTPTYNQYRYSRSSKPKLTFHSKNDSVELFGYTITNSLFYTCTSKSDMPFAIDTKSTPTFGYTTSESLNYWPNYNQINKTQQGFYIKWLSEGKPFVEELGYAYIYYYGLEYRALVEKQDLKDVLFEVIDLVNKFKRLRYGYDLITYLILSINNFSLDEIDLVLKFLKENEQSYAYNPAYNSILKNLTPAGQYKIKFSPYQILNNNEYNNLSDRKNELLSYYFDKVIENIEETELYTSKPQTYTYYMAMGYYRTNNFVTYNAIVPSTKVKRIWNQARKIIENEVTQPIIKFNTAATPLTETEKLIYMPSSLRKNINIPENSFLKEDRYLISDILNNLGFCSNEVLTIRQSAFIAQLAEIYGYSIEPDSRKDNKPYTVKTNIILYKNAAEISEGRIPYDKQEPEILLKLQSHNFKLPINHVEIADIEATMQKYIHSPFYYESISKKDLFKNVATFGYGWSRVSKNIEEKFNLAYSNLVQNNILSKYDDYNIAKVFLDLGYKIALEDKELLSIEIEYIDNFIKKEFYLTIQDRIRLNKRGELIVSTKQINSNETIKKLINKLDQSNRDNITRFLIGVAMADGVVKNSELKILQKIFRQLGLSEDYLNSTLSELINKADDVVIVEKGTSTKKKGSKIPADIELDEKLELKLDTEKLEKIKINTSEIHNVLQEIFAEEQAEILKSEPIEVDNSEDDDKTEIENGLQNIVNIIIEKENWTRNELLNVIQNKGMMLSSAIDEINEWSNEEFGDFLVEEDDDVYLVNEEVVNLIKK